jgi:hypothetical protein
MALIQRKAKMNDFRVASTTKNHQPQLSEAYSGVLGHTIGNKGSYLTDHRNRDFVFVYHMEKKRPKWTQKKVWSKGDQRDNTKSTQVRPGGWTLRVFKVPKDRVKSVKQHARHFDLELV